MVKITYKNATEWDAGDLLKLLRRALREEESDRTHVALIVSYAKGLGFPMDASARDRIQVGVAKTKVLLKLPRPRELTAMTPGMVKALAMRVVYALDIAREIWLSGGCAGRLYAGDWYAMPAEWAAEYSVARRPEPKKLDSSERAAKREAHARTLLARAEKDRDAAQARVDKWAKKVRYYDRKGTR